MSIHILLASNTIESFSDLIATLPKHIPDFEVSYATQHLSAKSFDIVAIDGAQASLALMQDLQQYQANASVQKLVIYNFQDTVQQGINYLASGVSGLFMHLCSCDNLAEKFRAVNVGQVYIEPELAQLLAMRQIRKLLQPFNTLCSRDFDVFCLLAEGFSIDDIAVQLGISSKTVFNCQTQIKKLLNLSSKIEIEQFAKMHGII